MEMAQVAHRRRGATLPRHLPGCWPKGYDKRKLRLVSIYKAKLEGEVYASEAFTWHLFNGERPQNLKPIDALPSYRLDRLLDRCLPGWKEIFQRRWTPLDLLKMSNHCADAAFLNMVHMYKTVLGQKGFPQGLFAWPPGEWAAKYHSRKRQNVASAPAPEGADGPAAKRRRLSSKTGCQPALSCSGSSSSSRPAKRGCQPVQSDATSSMQGEASCGVLTLVDKWASDSRL